MRFCLVTLALLAAVTASSAKTLNSHSYIDYRRLLNNVSPFACDSGSGIKCKGCREIVLCSGGVEIPMGTCPTNQICLNGNCISAQPNAECSTIKDFDFICSTVGVFPDPADCKKYHFCVPKDLSDEELVEFTAECQNDAAGNSYGYNPLTTYCSKKLTNNNCNGYPVAECLDVGQTGAVKESNSIFYVCGKHPQSIEDLENVTYPYQLACANGKPYNPSLKRCQD